MDAKFYYLRKHAHLMVQLAIYHGDLIPPTYCQQCGQLQTFRALDAHHEDYSQPLDVIWLCVTCHKETHNGKTYEAKKRHITQGVQRVMEWLTIHDPDNLLTVREAAKRANVSIGLMGTAKKRLAEAA